MSKRSEFFNRIKTKVQGVGETYECGDILIREDANTGICRAYSRRTEDVIRTDVISNVEIRKFISNIEDEKDSISYRCLALPGGRCKVINDQREQFSLYRLPSVIYALSGNNISFYERVTKDYIEELIHQYQSQKELMKYFKLERLYLKKDACYIGKYIEDGEIKYEELCGNVLSKFRYEDYGIGLKKSVVTNECLKDFGEHKTTLKFTARALQEIIERDREKESGR